MSNKNRTVFLSISPDTDKYTTKINTHDTIYENNVYYITSWTHDLLINKLDQKKGDFNNR